MEPQLKTTLLSQSAVLLSLPQFSRQIFTCHKFPHSWTIFIARRYHTGVAITWWYQYRKKLKSVKELARTVGAVAIVTDPLVFDASHLPDGVITWRSSRTSDVTGNGYDVTVACHLHAWLHCGIDAADNCSRDVTKYTFRFIIRYLVDFWRCKWAKTKPYVKVFAEQVKRKTRMWADAQHDGRLAEYRWRPLRKSRNSIPFRRKDSLMPAAGVLCSNAANIGESKTWTESEFCTWQNSVKARAPENVYILY